MARNITRLTRAEIKRDLREIGVVKRVPPSVELETPQFEEKRWSDPATLRSRREQLRFESERDWQHDADRRAHYAEVRRMLRTPFDVEELVKLEHADLDDDALLARCTLANEVVLTGRRWLERPQMQPSNDDLRAKVAQKQAQFDDAVDAFFGVIHECTASRRAAQDDYVRIAQLRDLIAQEKEKRGDKKRRRTDDLLIAAPTHKKRQARKSA